MTESKAESKPVDKALLRQAAERCRDAAGGSEMLSALRHLQNCFGWETVLNLLAEVDEADAWLWCDCGDKRAVGPCPICDMPAHAAMLGAMKEEQDAAY